MDIIEQFGREYWTYRGISDLRRREQRARLLQFEGFLAKPLTEATSRDVEQFLASLIEDHKLSPGMVNKVRGMISPFYGWAVTVGLVGADVGAAIRAVRSPRANEIPTLPRPYTRHELDAFYAELEQRLPRASEITLGRWRAGRAGYKRVYRHGMRLQVEAITGLALYCGLRRNEMWSIDLDDIAPENEYIVVRFGKDNPDPVPVPYPAELRKIIRTWLAWRAELGPEHDRPWLSLQSHSGNGPTTPMHRGRFYGLLNDLLDGGWTYHRFRHTCGTEWLRAGMPIEKVRQLLRHRDISMTLRYAEVAKQDVARSMVKAEPHFVAAVAPREAVAA